MQDFVVGEGGVVGDGLMGLRHASVFRVLGHATILSILAWTAAMAPLLFSVRSRYHSDLPTACNCVYLLTIMACCFPISNLFTLIYWKIQTINLTNILSTMRRKVREAPNKVSASTNPSKRHRERLNGELETVASLLPYDQTVISRLDKLSVLRLAVSYLEVKAHFQVSLQTQFVQYPHSYGYSSGYSTSSAYFPGARYDPVHADEPAVFKAIGGFVLILNENGEIYYTSDNIETYLGFHQSDILHQPIYDMVHSEDREEIRQQLLWSYSLPSHATNQDLYSPDLSSFLERNASARFRCLLDNTCGFLRIDIRGKLAPLHGLPHTYRLGRPDPGSAVLGLVAICSPFVPPPNVLDGPADSEPFLKTKHSLDLALCSCDPKAKALLELTEADIPLSFYSLVHHYDAICLAEAHKEVIKSGACGLLVYRLVSARSQRVYWVQSNCRLFYKNGKPDSIGCTHRALTEAEGLILLEKRASLSAKLLSFDDSLLQSPKLLQSTAALSSANLPSSNGGNCSTGKSAKCKQKNTNSTTAMRPSGGVTTTHHQSSVATAPLMASSSVALQGLIALQQQYQNEGDMTATTKGMYAPPPKSPPPPPATSYYGYLTAAAAAACNPYHNAVVQQPPEGVAWYTPDGHMMTASAAHAPFIDKVGLMNTPGMDSMVANNSNFISISEVTNALLG